MELTDLRYFFNVATVQSFKRGAALSHVSPPAISKTIAKLEAELGAPLFLRTTRRVLLTEAGEILLRRCRRIFDELAGVRQDLDEAAGEVAGTLRIGAMEVFSIDLLPMALARLVARYPRLMPQSHELIPQTMERMIVDGQLDVGFTIGGGGVEGVHYHAIGQSAGILACGRRHPLYRLGRVRTKDLDRYPFVAPRFHGMEHLPVLDLFPENRFPRRIGATIELLQMGLQLTVEGSYLGFFPEICVRGLLRAKHLRALSGLRLGVRFDLRALTRAGTRPRRAAELLIEELRNRTLRGP